MHPTALYPNSSPPPSPHPPNPTLRCGLRRGSSGRSTTWGYAGGYRGCGYIGNLYFTRLCSIFAVEKVLPYIKTITLKYAEAGTSGSYKCKGPIARSYTRGVGKAYHSQQRIPLQGAERTRGWREEQPPPAGLCSGYNGPPMFASETP